MAVGLDDGEVDLDVERPVEVVGQDVDGHVADHVAELGVAQPGGASGSDVGVADAAPGRHDRLGEGEDRRRLGVGGVEVPRALELIAVELGDVGAEVGVGREAVAALVGLGHSERDPLAGGGID